MPSQENYAIRPLNTGDVEQYNALLRYAFQITEQELSECGWQDDEIKQSKFPVLELSLIHICWYSGNCKFKTSGFSFAANGMVTCIHLSFIAGSANAHRA